MEESVKVPARSHVQKQGDPTVVPVRQRHSTKCAVRGAQLPDYELRTGHKLTDMEAEAQIGASPASAVSVIEFIEDIDFPAYSSSPSIDVVLRFRHYNGRDETLRLPRSELASPSKLIPRLIDKGAALSSSDKDALANLESQIPLARRKVTRETGWRNAFSCFVLPRRTIGQDRSLTFDLDSLMEPSHRGSARGSLKAWKSELEEPFAASSYLVFAAALAFAAPVVALLQIDETAVFHVFGESNAGKTLMLRAAESALGRASEDDLIRFNQTHAAFNDVISRYTGTLAPMNEMKTVASADLRKMLVNIAHVVTSGSGQNRSNYAKRDRELRLKKWHVIGMTNMEQSLDALMSGKRDAGERARHVDVPVPSVGEGGIFDRATKMKGRPRNASTLAQQVERAIEHNYGVAFPAFLSFLIRYRGTSKPRFQKDTETFIKKCAVAGGAWEERFARKFAFAYAGGRVAIRAGVLPVSERQLAHSCRSLYKRARASFTTPSEQAAKAMDELLGSLDDGRRFPVLEKSSVLSPDLASSCWGVRRTLPRLGPCLVVRPEHFQRLAGSDEAKKLMLAELASGNAYVPGHNGKSTRSVELKGMGRNRHLVFVMAALRALAERRTSAG